MNCDGVFKVLTRGPFPTGSSTLDVAVEHHLACCASCRRLATALQPAIEVFEEAVSPDESRSLPSYSGHLLSRKQESLRPLTRTRRTLRTTAPALRRRPRPLPVPVPWAALGRFGLAVLAGLVLSAVLRGLELRERREPGLLRAEAAEMSSRPMRLLGSPALLSAKLDAMHLGASCRPDLAQTVSFDATDAERLTFSAQPARRLAMAGISWEDNCCARCHVPKGTAAVRKLTTAAVFKVTQSCGLCHQE